jgi:hypothetical protein
LRFAPESRQRRKLEALYAIADQQGWLVGETLERALAAVRRELAGQAYGNPGGPEGED